MVSCFVFKSYIHVEFLVVCGVRVCSSFIDVIGCLSSREAGGVQPGSGTEQHWVHTPERPCFLLLQEDNSWHDWEARREDG